MPPKNLPRRSPGRATRRHELKGRSWSHDVGLGDRLMIPARSSLFPTDQATHATDGRAEVDDKDSRPSALSSPGNQAGLVPANPRYATACGVNLPPFGGPRTLRLERGGETETRREPCLASPSRLVCEGSLRNRRRTLVWSARSAACAPYAIGRRGFNHSI